MITFLDFEKAVEDLNENRIREILLESSLFCFREPDGSSLLNEHGWQTSFLNAVSDPRLHDRKILADLLMWIQQDWGALDEACKDKILRTLREAASTYSDSDACFVVSELLGEFFDPHDARPVVRELSKHPDAPVKAFLPHAIFHILEDVPSPEGDDMFGLLRSLQVDPDPIVQDEANTVMAALQSKYKSP